MSATAALVVALPVRPRTSYRPDLEGLRAVAILAVVLFHSGVPLVAGGYVGVDVFLVISGFLITGIVAGVLRQPTVSAAAVVVLRRLGRLVPAATLLMLSLALTAWAVLPALDQLPLGEDIVAASLGRMNVRLQRTSTDYLNSDATPSLLQHFWSLSVEWQFYGICLAVILVGMLSVILRRGTGPSGGVQVRRAEAPESARGADAAAGSGRALAIGAVVLVVGAVASFVWNVSHTYAEPALSYLALWSRLWEFGLGGMCWVALLWLTPRFPPAVAGALSLSGLVAIVAAVVALGMPKPFPGWIALAPTLGAAAIILGGTCPNPVTRWLGRPAAVYVGARSYAWYLWHWPPLILVTMLLFEPPWPLALAISGATFGIAIVTYRVFERPLRLWSRNGSPRAVAAVMAGMVLSTVAAGAYLTVVSQEEEDRTLTLTEAAASRRAGAALTGPRGRYATEVAPARNPSQAVASLPRIYADGCHADVANVDVSQCRYGDPSGEPEVVLLGDSHAAQWFPALEAAAQSQHWQLRSLTKSSCPGLTLPEFWIPTLRREYRECGEWTRNALASIRADKPDLVIMATRGGYQVSAGPGSPQTPEASSAPIRAALGRTVRQMAAEGIAVVVLESTAVAPDSVPECLARRSAEQCAVPLSSMLQEDDYLAAVAVELGLPRILVRDLQCPTDPCPTTRDGVIIMRDAQHLTADYSQRLAGQLVERLAPVTPSRASGS